MTYSQISLIMSLLQMWTAPTLQTTSTTPSGEGGAAAEVMLTCHHNRPIRSQGRSAALAQQRREVWSTGTRCMHEWARRRGRPRPLVTHLRRCRWRRRSLHLHCLAGTHSWRDEDEDDEGHERTWKTERWRTNDKGRKLKERGQEIKEEDVRRKDEG